MHTWQRVSITIRSMSHPRTENKIRKIISRHGCAQSYWKEHKDIEVAKRGKRSRGKKQQRAGNRSASSSYKNDQPERQVSIVLQRANEERVQ